MGENAAVGIVLVSHSARLAEGAAEVAGQMAAGVVDVLGVGGTEDGRLGTDADALAAAVEKVAGPAGVLLIPDLGSSVLSAKSYLSDTDLPSEVLVADAPFVEGAVAAAVAASSGASLADVLAAAEGARDARKL
jgi:phosphoenolpyruvate---glycerone phosphotransferase subunit DhaM